MNPLIDHLLHGGELVALLLLLLGAIKFVNRVDSVMKDYPPHRHVGSQILYPKDYPPARAETLETTR